MHKSKLALLNNNQGTGYRTVPLSSTRVPMLITRLPHPTVFSRTIDKQGSLAPASGAAERISFPLYLTCSSGSQQTVKGHKTAGRKACKYLNHYLSQGPSLSFTASHQDRMQSGNRVVPSPQTAHTNTHTYKHTHTTPSILYSPRPDRAQLQIP